MTFLPVVDRELRTASRQRATHHMRLIAAILALVIWFMLSVFGHMTSPQRAQAVFGTIGVLSLGFALLAGAFLTADCLSEERREGTLGLLFLTDLKGHDVVLGKLASTSLNSIYGLLAVVPVLAIPLLMGGVTSGEFVRTTLVLLVTLFLSLSTGMFVSAVSHDSRVAFLRTLLIIVVLSGVLPLVWWALGFFLRARQFDFLLWPSPGYALRCAGDSFFSTRSGAGEFWVSLLVIGFLGIFFLAIASALLPRVWQQMPDENNKLTKSTATSSKRRNELSSGLESRPYFWFALRDDRMGRWATWIIGMAVLFWFVLYLRSASSSPGGAPFALLFLIAFVLHVFFKCMLIAEATRRLSEGRQNGALELLLVTPLKPQEIIQGEKAAVARLFRRPKLMLIVMNLLLIGLMIWPDLIGWMGRERTVFATMFIGGLILLFADCFVIGPTAVLSALTTKRHTRAILKTIRTVLLPSWVALMLFWFYGVSGRGLSSETVQTMVILWIAIGLIVDGIILGRTRARLTSGFRELVATGTARTKKSRSNAGV